MEKQWQYNSVIDSIICRTVELASVDCSERIPWARIVDGFVQQTVRGWRPTGNHFRHDHGSFDVVSYDTITECWVETNVQGALTVGMGHGASHGVSMAFNAVSLFSKRYIYLNRKAHCWIFTSSPQLLDDKFRIGNLMYRTYRTASVMLRRVPLLFCANWVESICWFKSI